MSIAGSWTILVETPMGRQPMLLQARDEGQGFGGTLTWKQATVDVLEGVVDGEKAQWKARFTRPFPMALEFETALSGDELSGVVRAGSLGAVGVSGTRTAPAPTA